MLFVDETNNFKICMNESLSLDNFEIQTNISCDDIIAPPPLHFQRRGLFIC